MQISEIRIKLIENRSDRLKAFCSVTFDNDFVIRDLKIIEGTNGYFVAMPSRKLTDHCPSCGYKNHLRARFCNDCGATLPDERARRNNTGRTKLHADVAHPVNSECREYIQSEIVKAFEKELDLSAQPGYSPPDMENFSESPNDISKSETSKATPPQPSQESESGESKSNESGFSDGI